MNHTIVFNLKCRSHNSFYLESDTLSTPQNCEVVRCNIYCLAVCEIRPIDKTDCACSGCWLRPNSFCQCLFEGSLLCVSYSLFITLLCTGYGYFSLFPLVMVLSNDWVESLYRVHG